VIFAIGIFVGRQSNSIDNHPVSETRLQGQYSLISPLLECDAYNFAPSNNLHPLRNQINDYIYSQKNSGHISHASVYFRDLTNGPWFGIDEKEYFSPASLVKVPIMMAYYKLAESNPQLLTQTIEIQTTLPDNQNIDPSITLTPHQTYTIEELIRRMIVYSDNEAYEILQNNIENNQIVQTYTDLGIDISRGFTDPSGNILTVKDYASFFRILYNASYLSKPMSQKALEILSQIDYQDGLVKGVNDSKITIAHKFGERQYNATNEKQLHDCGIIYSPQKPFLLCIMTRGNDFNSLSSTIRQITATVFQSVNKK